MISVDEALELVRVRVESKPAVTVSLSQALGRVLAEEIACDRDSPPWDKAMVDGYAVVAADLTSGRARLQIVEEVIAGAVPKIALRAGQATRVMTGAPIPAGCDAMVMVERTTTIPDGAGLGYVEIEECAKVGQNILRQGVAVRAGEMVLAPGAKLRPVEIGVLAEVGRAEVRVAATPRVAVLSTGNELVACDRLPGPGQIRNSNGPMLLAAVRELGAEAIDLGIARDEVDALRVAIRRGLEGDVLVLSGGVSAGVLDLVPQLLQESGVEQVFHKIRLKPGKPLWFGTQQGGEHRCLVFGLPGNPVSSHVCFQLFVRPAIAALGGSKDELQTTAMRLTSNFTHRGDRPTYHPAQIADARSQTVEPVRWQGSADLYGLSRANALIHFPAGDRVFEAGDEVDVLVL